MAFLRTVITSTTAAAAAAAVSALPPAFSPNYLFSPSPSRSKTLTFSSISSNSIFGLALVKSLTKPPQALHMDASIDHKLTPQDDAELPELLTEFMVDMHCEGCVKAVKNKLQTVNGVKNVDVDLSNQVVRILASSPVKTMAEALEQTGRKARLIGQGVPEDFLVSAAVAEFKGPNIFGVVRVAQVNMELARIEANFSGLSPGKHGWCINEFGDLTKGVASTGKVFNSTIPMPEKEPHGDLGTLHADGKGEALFSGVKPNLRVPDLIGRAIAVYETEDKSDPGLSAAVIARSAGVGENYKKLCTCDGTTIWEATNSDFVPSKV